MDARSTTGRLAYGVAVLVLLQGLAIAAPATIAEHGTAASLARGAGASRGTAWDGLEAGWTMFHGGSGVNGSYTDPFPWSHFSLRWTQNYSTTAFDPTNTGPTAPQSSPVIYNGTIYLMESATPVLLSVNATNGAPQGTVNLAAGTGIVGTVTSTPLIAGSAGYPFLSQSTYSAGTHETYALNLTSGTVTYCHSGQPGYGGAGPIPGGFVQPSMPYGGNPDGIFIFHDWNLGDSGTVNCPAVATMTSTDAFYDTPSVGLTYDPANASAPYADYFLSDQSQPTVDAFPVGGGAQIWADKLGGIAYGSLALTNVSYPVTGKGGVSAPVGFIVNDAGTGKTSNISAIDVNCGVAHCFSGGNTSNTLPNGTYPLAAPPGADGGSNATVALRPLSSRSIQVFYASRDGTLGSVQATLTGSSSAGPNATGGYNVSWTNPWTFASGAPLTASPVTVNGLVIDGNDNGTVFVLNASDGALVWSGNLTGAILSSPALGPGGIYILTSTGELADIGPTHPYVSLGVPPVATDGWPMNITVAVNGTSVTGTKGSGLGGALVTALVSGGSLSPGTVVGTGTTSPSGTVRIAWTPPYVAANVTYNFTAIVNATGYTLANATGRTVAIPPPPLHIVSLQATPSLLQIGNSTTLVTNVTGGFRPYSYVYTGLPGNCTSLNSSSLPCTPSTSGNFTVTVHVSDPAGAVNSTSTLLSVRNRTIASLLILSFTATPSSVQIGNSTRLNATVSGGLLPYHFAYAGLPAGCASADALPLNCTPTAGGTFDVVLTVTDARGTTASANLTLTVVPRTIGPLEVTLVAVPSVLVQGSSTTFTSTVRNGTAPYLYAYSGLPPGCTSSDTSSLTCVPTSAGVFHVTLSVSDAKGATASAGATLTVDPAGSGRLSVDLSAAPATFILGNATTFTATAHNGSTPYRYVYSGLPPGCLSQNVASWACTPTAAGNFTVVVTVTDSGSVTAQGSTSVSVLPRTVVPLVIVRFGASVNPVGIGERTDLNVTLSGGSAPFRFVYTGLPSGCVSTNEAVLSCTPDASGNFSVNVSVTDAYGQEAHARLTLLVMPHPTSGGGPSLGLPLTDLWLLILFLLAIGLLLLLLYGRRRRKAPISESGSTPADRGPSPTSGEMGVAAGITGGAVATSEKSPPATEWSEGEETAPEGEENTAETLTESSPPATDARTGASPTEAPPPPPASPPLETGPEVDAPGDGANGVGSTVTSDPEEVESSATEGTPDGSSPLESPAHVELERTLGPERSDEDPFGGTVAPEEVNPNVQRLDPRLFRSMELSVKGDAPEEGVPDPTSPAEDFEKKTQDLMQRARKAREGRQEESPDDTSGTPSPEATSDGEGEVSNGPGDET